MTMLITAAIIALALTVDVSAITTPTSMDYKTSSVDSIYNSTINSDGICICNVQVTTVNGNENSEIYHIQEQVSRLEAQLTQQQELSNNQSQEIGDLNNMIVTAFEKLRKIENGEIVITILDFENLRQEIVELEALLLVLRQNSSLTPETLITLQEEIVNITLTLLELDGSANEYTTNLLDSIKDLKQRLTECQDMDAFIPWAWDVHPPVPQDSCSNLVHISDSHTVREMNSDRGTWFRDPIVNQEKIHEFVPGYRYYAATVYTYNTVKKFREGAYDHSMGMGTNVRDTGMVAYNGSLYFGIFNCRCIGKYDITLEQQGQLSLPSDVYIDDEAPYLSGSYSSLDFAVDETGLWLIYATSSNNGLISISKVDPMSLQLTQNWTTNLGKGQVGNCFIICQILYCTDDYSTQNHLVNYYFDTKTGQEGFTNVPIDSRFNSVYALDYNPYDQKLYAWDSGFAVVYNLNFEDD